jgi:hypothetical protein
VNRFFHVPCLLLAALLGLAGPGHARADPAADLAAARAELAGLAPRIEQLKRDAAGGRPPAELERLLARAQELASRIERLAAPAAAVPAPAARPDAQELRERADALRDRADRLAAALVQLDARLAEARRRAALAEQLDALGATSDLFADAAPGRGVAEAGPRGAGTTAAPPPAPAAPGGDAASVGPGLRGAVEPGGAGDGTRSGDDLASLRRSRAELVRSLAGLREQAAALDAEAAAAARTR